MTGLLRPQRDTVKVAHHRTEVQSCIGVAFEAKNLCANMSVKENLLFFAKLFCVKDHAPEAGLRRVQGTLSEA